jgi:hypothetical protein
MTITLELDNVLRLWVSDDIRVMGSDEHDMIGIAVSALAKPVHEPIPTELVLTPLGAAGLLALLRDMELDGRIPKKAVASVRSTRQ